MNMKKKREGEKMPFLAENSKTHNTKPFGIDLQN
jgi:hypothetical protein